MVTAKGSAAPDLRVEQGARCVLAKPRRERGQATHLLEIRLQREEQRRFTCQVLQRSLRPSSPRASALASTVFAAQT